MAYTIIELQTDVGGATISTPNRSETDLDIALSKWHETCMHAAISSVYLHVVILLGPRGEMVEKREFNHVPSTPQVSETTQDESQGDPITAAPDDSIQDTDGDDGAEGDGQEVVTIYPEDYIAD